MTSSVLNGSTGANARLAKVPAVSITDKPLRVEPLAALEWSAAIELPAAAHRAKSPADARSSWVHKAPEARVLDLYRAARAADPCTEGPWWLAALTGERLASRAAAFALEDRVATMLLARPGWVYAPWSHDGYWEYLPSESRALNPTALVFTGRHDGWLDVVPAYDEDPAEPIAVSGAAALRADLGWIEKL